MAVFPTSAIDPDDTSVKVKERYTSAALNRKLTGYPLGVFRGLTPLVTGPTALSLLRSTRFLDSVAVAEDAGGYGLNVRLDSDVALDFTGHTSYPTYVVLEVTYSPPAPLGAGTTSATLRTVAPATIDHTVAIGVVTSGPFLQGEEINFSGGATGRLTVLGASLIVALRGTVLPAETAFGATSGASAPVTSVTDPGAFPKQVKVCLVDKPGATITVKKAVPVDRQEPFAFTGVTAGFMPGGSIEQLQLAVAITSEVQQARTGFLQTFANLDARLDAELAGSGTNGMASRLGLVAKTQEGSFFSAATPGWSGSGTSANVSADFLLKTPALLVTDKGVVVSDPGTPSGDTVNNVCLMFDQQYSRLIDAVGRKVYGRLIYSTLLLTGTLTFANGSVAVSGGGSTLFQTDGVQPGDIILSPNGNFFAVASVTDEDNLVLQTSYTSTGPPTEIIATPPLRRYQINFQIYASGDTPFSLPSTTEFRYSYQERFDAANRPFSEATFHPSLRGRDAGVKLTADGTTADVRTAPSTTDARLGAVKINGGAFRQNVALVQGANMTINVVDTGTDYQITFTASGGGGGGPGAPSGVPPADGGGGTIGDNGNYTGELHQHPVSGAYLAAGTQTLTSAFKSTSGSTGNDVFTHGLTNPKALFTFSGISGTSCFGFAIAGLQGCITVAQGTIIDIGSIPRSVLADLDVSGTGTLVYSTAGLLASPLTLVRSGASGAAAGLAHLMLGGA